MPAALALIVALVWCVLVSYFLATRL